MAAPILSAATGANDTLLLVGDTSELTDDSVIVIDSEQMLITEIKDDRINVRRGILGSTRAAHLVDAPLVAAGDLYVIGTRRVVHLAAATQNLTAAQSGEKFVGAVDAIFTLPAAANDPDMEGVWYEFECGALSTGVGLSISPAAADAIGGNGLTVTVNKDLINSGASDRLGDMVRIYCTGVTGATAWRIENVIGTWAKEG